MTPVATSPTLRAVWNLRMLALFLLGPIVGVALVASIFGMPPSLIAVAGAMFLFSLAMFGILVQGERRRLSRGAAVRHPPRA